MILQIPTQALEKLILSDKAFKSSINFKGTLSDIDMTSEISEVPASKIPAHLLNELVNILTITSKTLSDASLVGKYSYTKSQISTWLEYLSKSYHELTKYYVNDHKTFCDIFRAIMFKVPYSTIRIKGEDWSVEKIELSKTSVILSLSVVVCGIEQNKTEVISKSSIAITKNYTTVGDILNQLDCSVSPEYDTDYCSFVNNHKYAYDKTGLLILTKDNKINRNKDILNRSVVSVLKTYSGEIGLVNIDDITTIQENQKIEPSLIENSEILSKLKNTNGLLIFYGVSGTGKMTAAKYLSFISSRLFISTNKLQSLIDVGIESSIIITENKDVDCLTRLTNNNLVIFVYNSQYATDINQDINKIAIANIKFSLIAANNIHQALDLLCINKGLINDVVVSETNTNKYTLQELVSIINCATLIIEENKILTNDIFNQCAKLKNITLL